MIGVWLAIGLCVVTAVFLGLAWVTVRERYLWWALGSCVLTIVVAGSAIYLEGGAA